MVRTHDKQVVLRIASDLLERADNIAKAIGTRPEFSQVRLSQAAVLRMAIAEGLEALEARYPAKRKK